MKKPLVILTGPTAVGKTALSLALARRINGEIISADSMQVYRHMDIGTAKIRPDQMQGIPHYLIDVMEPDEEFNIVKFQMLAKQALAQIYQKGKIPIVVGGTGFYIQSLVYDISFQEEQEDDGSLRKKLEQQAEDIGVEALHQMLCKVDEAAADAIHPNNKKKVIRALEYYYQTGQKISEHNETERKKESPYQVAYFVLNQPRELLYERINQRIDAMLAEGLLEEVRKLAAKGYDKSLVSMQGLGYKEILSYLEGDLTLEEAIYQLKRDTRHFAKRQITWFKRERDVIWFNKDEYIEEAAILEDMLLTLQEKSIITEKKEEEK
ncbi:MAG: tRNA dimethylallyltransferase [Clostridiales bacterium]|nr:tRNA dimethylallyltransferase [Clostridiales bacterium]